MQYLTACKVFARKVRRLILWFCWWLQWRPLIHGVQEGGKMAEMLTWSIDSPCWCLLAIRRTEYKPAIDKANSLVSHSAPSKPPLNAHQHEWLAPHTGKLEGTTHFLSSHRRQGWGGVLFSSCRSQKKKKWSYGRVSLKHHSDVSTWPGRDVQRCDVLVEIGMYPNKLPSGVGYMLQFH